MESKERRTATTATLANRRAGLISLSVLAVSAGLAGAASGCIGNIGDNEDGGGDGDNNVTTSGDLSCDTSLIPDALPLRRLSRAQYENTVHDLLRQVLPADADSIFTDLQARLDTVPNDLAKGPVEHFATFQRLDQAVHQEHIDAMYEVAAGVGEAFTASPERMTSVFGACSTDADASNDDACLDDFIRSFGELALRRPVTEEDVTFYRGPAGPAPFEAADYADVAALLLNSPYHFYLVEHGEEAVEGKADVYRLGAYEMASRLSYHFWQTMPDAELFEAARSGALLTPEGYQAQVNRIYADARTARSIEHFYEEWLHRHDVDELDSRLGTPVFDAFIEDYTPGPDLREHMFEELGVMGRYFSHDTDGTLEDVFTSNASFATTDDLASLYGVPTWDGVSAPPAFPEADRVGLLTRAAMLATGSANTRPIMKGVFIRKALLCGDIPPPPPDVDATPPDLSADLTTREVVEQLTEQPGSNCAGCHTTVINHLGFATENFDSLGRFRTAQKLYDPETGDYLGEKPVNTVSTPQVVLGDTQESSGAADLSQQILESGSLQSCFARVYFRYTFGRAEDLDKDGCALVALRERLVEGAPLSEVLREIALVPEFAERAFVE